MLKEKKTRKHCTVKALNHLVKRKPGRWEEKKATKSQRKRRNEKEKMATLTGRRDGASTRGRSRRAASPFSAKKKSQSEARVLVHRRHRALVLCRRMPSIPSRRMPSIRLSRSFKMARRRRRRRRLICIQVCERKANPFAAVDADWSTSR